MSLINKMLNELENRKQEKIPERSEILSGISPAVRKHKLVFERKIFIGLIILIAVAGALFYFRAEIITGFSKTADAVTKSSKAMLAKGNSLVPKAPPAAPKKAAAAKGPEIKLKDIVLHFQNNKTIMDFVLSAPTMYFIEHSADGQQLFITFTNTGLLGNLPVVLENSFVIALNTKQSGTSTVCTLTLLPGTKVDELQLAEQPKPQLHLELSNKQITDSKMLKILVPVSPEQETKQRYQQIKKLLTQNQISEAITQLHMFVGDFPGHRKARQTLAALLIKEDELTKSNSVLTIGLNKNPNYIPFIKLKARILAAQGKTDSAIYLLQKHSASFGKDTEGFALLAVLCQQKGRFMQAARFYNQLTKIQPQNAKWWVGLGLALESMGKKNAAKEAYQRAYDCSDASPDLIMFLTDKVKE